ncbi:MAG: FecR family protein [Spirosomataceae bacterium]
MSKYHFHLLLSRYRKGECTYQEKQLVEQWFALLDSEKPKVKEEETQQIEERIWKAIQQRQQKKPTMYQWNLFSFRNSCRQVLIVAIAWGGYQWLGKVERGISVKQLSNGLTHQTNNSQTIVLRLDDGTEINLAPQSSLKYPAQFKSNNREVFLDGKAFFKVAHNPQKPFLVYTGEVVTKVLGTSFWIDTEGKNKAVEVSVVSGKVSVFQRDARNDFVSEKIKSGVILTPNQKVKYIEGSQAFETSLVENPVLLSKGEKDKEIHNPLFLYLMMSH